ncbi:hypothetical protein [Cupriavidus sp. TMH.W2]|uniref:hypothetical protein n=1 Tax=Cupriavidus sp. TMH.W2 TaxID=3434465 RepID=UPI003D77D357
MDAVLPAGATQQAPGLPALFVAHALPQARLRYLANKRANFGAIFRATIIASL